MRIIKSALRYSSAWLYYYSNRFLSHLEGKVLILTYHRVLSREYAEKNFVQTGMYVYADIFEMHMLFVRKYFKIVSFNELIEIWHKGTWDKKARYCVVTFDDGWLDNYLYAFPILKGNSIPATIFLPTAFIGTAEWFWPEKIAYIFTAVCREGTVKAAQFHREFIGPHFPWLRELREFGYGYIDSVIENSKCADRAEIDRLINTLCEYLSLAIPRERLVLNWGEILEMSKEQISFGSHTMTHPILTSLPVSTVRHEAEGSWGAIMRSGANATPVFCYPNGDWSNEIVDVLKSLPYKAAVTTMYGLEEVVPTSRFALSRVGIHNGNSANLPLFAWHISGMNQIFSRIMRWSVSFPKK